MVTRLTLSISPSSKVVDQLDVGDDPERFDLSPDGRYLYASNEDDGLLTVFDLEQKKTVAEIEVGDEPEGVMASPDGRTVYVSSEVANMVHVVDVETNAVKANVLVGNRPRRFAIDRRRKGSLDKQRTGRQRFRDRHERQPGHRRGQL